MILPISDVRCEIVLPTLDSHGPRISELFKDKLLKADTTVVFSAHFDDAVLSMGSTMAYLLSVRKKIIVVTVFTRGYNAISLQTEFLLNHAGFANHEDYFASRAQENATALAILGDCTIINLGYTDAPWRLDTNASFLYPEVVIGSPHNEDHVLRDKIITSINNIQVPENCTIITHLAWGNHVDHIITRDASLAVFPQAIFYRDFPYSRRYPEEYRYPIDHELEAVDWYEPFYDKKAKSILAYKTQCASLFRVNPMVLPLERFYMHGAYS